MPMFPISDDQRTAFRDWLRKQLRDADPPFYNARGDHYLVREFHKHCEDSGHPIDEASLGRYLRDENPVIPTPDRCRALAGALKLSPIDVMIQAGLVQEGDWKPQKG